MNNKSIIILLILVAFSCSPSYISKISTSDKPIVKGNGVPDYNHLYYWAAHPDKKDPSDSISSVLQLVQRDTTADVFFLHPTTYTTSFNGYTNADIHNDTLNAKTDYSSILYQASIFNEQENIFAPRYRQANINMYYFSDTAMAKKAFDTAYSDIKKAFLHYLGLNRNKPIILAAHSQGTQHAARLIKEFFDGTALQQKLVLAYLVGMPVPQNVYTNIKPCTDSTQTGCFVSWRTFRERYEGPDYIKLEPPVVVINPLTWNTDSSTAAKSNHLGALLYNFNKRIPAPNNATVHNNILWVSRPKFPGSFLYTAKNYHVGDFNLFYFNIRKDVSRRLMYYLNR
jgi:hypothetical protein